MSFCAVILTMGFMALSEPRYFPDIAVEQGKFLYPINLAQFILVGFQAIQ